MATVTSTRAGSTKPVKSGVHGNVHVVTSSYSITANPTANDYLQMVPVPKGAKIVDVILTSTDIDTNGTPTVAMTVGDQDGTPSDNRYITTSTIGQAGGVARLNAQGGHLYTFAADGTIDVKFTTASATFASGTITMTVIYTTDAAA